MGGGGAMGDGGAMTGGVPGVCPMGSTSVLLSDLAEADSDELWPGRPAVAADGERFLVVSPRISSSYQHSAVVGALVSKEGTPGFAGNGGAGIFGAGLDANGALLDDVMGDGLLFGEVPEDFSRFLLPAMAPMGDRGLLVWLDNNELSGKTKAVRGARLCPL